VGARSKQLDRANDQGEAPDRSKGTTAAHRGRQNVPARFVHECCCAVCVCFCQRDRATRWCCFFGDGSTVKVSKEGSRPPRSRSEGAARPRRLVAESACDGDLKHSFLLPRKSLIHTAHTHTQSQIQSIRRLKDSLFSSPPLFWLLLGGELTPPHMGLLLSKSFERSPAWSNDTHTEARRHPPLKTHNTHTDSNQTPGTFYSTGFWTHRGASDRSIQPGPFTSTPPPPPPLSALAASLAAAPP
jgi:hypothetical protein